MRDRGCAGPHRMPEMVVAAGHTNQPPSGRLEQPDNGSAVDVYLCASTA
jgi:hypothetical protein